MHRLGIGLFVPWFRLGGVLLTTFLASGCGAGKGDVSGTVTFQGKPLPLGTITFMGSDNQAVGSSAITEGKYAMSKVRVGPVKIIVTVPPYSETAGHVPRKRPGKELPKDAAPEIPALKRVPRVVIPEKYAVADLSGLTYTVQPGNQEHNIDLE